MKPFLPILGAILLAVVVTWRNGQFSTLVLTMIGGFLGAVSAWTFLVFLSRRA